MLLPERDKLKGDIEVDETYIGGKEVRDGKQGLGAETKKLVVIATECHGKQIGPVRFKCISEATSDNLIQFNNDNIETGSHIITDRWSGYK